MQLVRAEIQKFRNYYALKLGSTMMTSPDNEPSLATASKLVDALERVLQLVEEMERLESGRDSAAKQAREAGRYDLSEAHRIYATRLRKTRLAIARAMTAAFIERNNTTRANFAASTQTSQGQDELR